MAAAACRCEPVPGSAQHDALSRRSAIRECLIPVTIGADAPQWRSHEAHAGIMNTGWREVAGERGELMAAQVVTYRVDDATTVKFEIEPTEGFHPAGPDQVLGKVQEAVGPAVEAAKAVLDKVKEARPDEVELKFGIKVSGGANWLVAKAAGEANFEVSLTWSRPVHQAGAADSEH